MKMKKFLASVLAALMAVSSMSFIASAQEAEESAEVAAETVTITFNAQNGAYKKETVNGVKNTWVNYAVSTADVEVGATVTFPEDPTYIYHDFLGWSTEIDGEVIEDLSAVTATEATTYYGVWEWNLAKGTPVESMYAHNEESKMATENGTSGGVWYDATTGSVYKRFLNVAGKNPVRCNMYNGINYSLPGSELHMVALVRTNLTEGKNTSAGIHNSSKKDGTSFGSSLTSTNNFSEEDVDEWKIVYLSNNTFADFGVGTHVDFNITGDAPANDIENDYFDVAGMALFGTSEEVQAFDIEAATAYNGEAVVSFDAQLTEDDDTDVYTEYPENLENDGNALVGWTLDPNAETVEYVDLTKVPVPTADVTYYAVWNEERTINFYKNDGTDAVETLTLGKGAAIEAPEFTSEGKKFLGWAESADGEIVEVQATAEESKDYYAIWLNNWLTKIVVNEHEHPNNASLTSGKWFGIENLETASRLDFVMPYGYPTSIVPTIVPTAVNGEAVYNAPETFDGEGSIVMGDITIPVTFTVADKDTVKDLQNVPTAGVNNSGLGLYSEKENTEKGLSATKFIPIYSEEESKKYGADKYLPTKGTGIEGWGAFIYDGYNVESYDMYRALVYYDTGDDGVADKDFVPSINHTSYGSRGAVRNKAVSALGNLKGDRWEYAYFVIPEDVYGWTMQPAFSFMGGNNANAFKNDVIYVAKIDLLVDGDEEYLQYAPMGLSSTNETNAKNDGTITGVTADMEIAVGDGEYVAVTEYTFENGVITGLAPAMYSVRYAGDDKYAPSESVELVVAPDSVEIYFEDGDPATNVIEQVYAYEEAITAPETAPEKTGYKFAGWALEDTEEAYDFTDVTATAELDGATFNALWEKVTVFYVDGTASANGNGFTAETPMTAIADAWNAIGEYDGTIYVVGETALTGNITGNGGNITVTAANDDASLTWSRGSTAKFNRGNGGSIKFENITIRYFDANSDNGYQFMNFKGLGYEFGEGVVVPTGEVDGVKHYNLKVRSGGEDGDNITVDGNKVVPVGEKVVIRSGSFGGFHLGGKGKATIEDIDVEYYGGSVTLNVGNDNASGDLGVLTNAKVLLEAKPSAVQMNNVSAMTGTYQFIANNGVDTVPAIAVTPAGGTWLIYSAEGGRADFGSEIGTYKFTTDKTYIVVTDAEGNSTKYRAADGATGDANLYADEATLELALEAGTYNISYTDEGVSVKGMFAEASMSQEFELNAANNYTAQVSESLINRLNRDVAAGYKFSGEFATEDGKYKTVNGAITVTEYTSEYIALYPVYVEDDTVAYYHATGLYNEKLATYDVTVAIANGKFTSGTVGGTFDKNVVEFTGYTVGEEVSNDIGDAPAIVKDAMYDGEDNKFVFVWNAKAGSVDATEEDVAIITFHFNVKDADAVVNGDAVSFYHPDAAYDEYFDGNRYLASPVNGENDDQFAVSYVPVYEGKVALEYAPTDPATITVKVNMPDKAGATADNIAYLAYTKNGDDWTFIALEEAGNEGNIEKVISDVFFVGETYNFTILKNGYIGSEMKSITLEDGMTFEATILGGDIKDSFTGAFENAVDVLDFGEGNITLADFVRVVRAFDAEATDEYKAVVDINEDGAVTVEDLAIVKTNYGKCYEDVEIIVSIDDAD